MKKFIFSIFIGIIALTSCSKEDIYPTIKIRTTQASSRSTFENNVTSWCKGDYLSVLFSANDVNQGPHRFDLADPANGTFECNNANLDPSLSYNIYALHQADATINGSQATIKIGAPIQTQDAASSAHVALFDPLYGFATNSQIDKISIQLEHLASVLKFNVSNGLDTPIKIQSVNISTSSGAKLCGTYSLDLKTGTQDEQTTNDNITLNIDNAPTLQADETMTLWVATAPFELAQGESLQFTITTNDGTYTHTQTMASKVTFGAGKIKSMTQAIELSSNSVQPASKSFVYDFTNSENYPTEGFLFPTKVGPNSSNWDKENVGKELTYSFNGKNLTIKSDVEYYHYKNSTGTINYLAFVYKNENEQSLIYLPKYNGYKIINVVVEVPNENKNVKFCLCKYTNSEWSIASNESYPSKTELTFTPNNPTSVDDKFALRLWATQNNNTGSAQKIYKITINYELVNN